MPTPRDPWPALESRYTDQYGAIDLPVYDTAGEIWPEAVAFAEFALGDYTVAFELMVKAAALVTARLASGSVEIRNMKAYLFRTYKHLVGQEKAKRLRQGQPLAEDSLVVEIVENLERKIMLEELFSKMTEDERKLSLYLMLGYTYDEIAAEIGESSTALRQRFSRLRRRIARISDPADAIQLSD